MHNGILGKKTESQKTEYDDMEKLKEFFEDKEKVFGKIFENVEPRPLSEYSTTELKAELRRRKNNRRW